MNDDINDLLIKQQEHILNAVTVIKEDITEIKVIQARHDENLKEHMKRSLANEEAVNILKNEFKPVQEHVSNVNFVVKVGSYLAGAIAAVYGIVEIILAFRH
jgi:hypothetical protein